MIDAVDAYKRILDSDHGRTPTTAGPHARAEPLGVTTDP
jgi:hypothetical protein